MSPELANKIEQIKKNNIPIFQASINNTAYIYRGINRKEFRDLQGLMAKMADELRLKHKDDEAKLNSELALLKEKGEEKLFLKCLVSPELDMDLDVDVIPAGVVTKVADLIMKASGFDDNEPEVTQL